MVSRILAVIVGGVGIGWVLTSAIRTVVIPRPERVWITTTSFELARRAANALAKRVSPRRRHAILGTFAPTVLITLPLIWSFGLIGFFASIYWGADIGSIQESIELSGSALTTLGFASAPSFGTRLLVIAQGLIGLAIVALMISFLPSLYGTFSRREIAVGRLMTRAGSPPTPVTFVARLHEIGRLQHIGERWQDWEDWFVELGETHTSFPALIYFRSASPQRSWITAAETALDTAALVSAADLAPSSGQADTMIRSGYLALRSIADFYRIEPERNPGDFEAISVDRSDFESALDELEAAGLPATGDRNAAWVAFAGWRVNYDRSICGLRDLIGDIPSCWTDTDEQGW